MRLRGYMSCGLALVNVIIVTAYLGTSPQVEVKHAKRLELCARHPELNGQTNAAIIIAQHPTSTSLTWTGFTLLMDLCPRQ